MASNTEVSSAVESHPTPQLDMEESEKGTHLEDEEKEDSIEARGSTSGRKDSTAKSVKRGHLRVGEDGQTMYKRTPTSAIMAAIQLGIGYSVGRLAAKPERDVLMVDFSFVEKVWFPSTGSRETPSHKFSDFRFKSYAPVAFRYFRDLFGIQPSDFLMSLSHEEVREVGNPGASGSLFFLSKDDMFIVKTVQHKEAVFLQQLLPGYYMNLHQNPRTLLPKFFGLYCYQSGSTNIRLAVMNNLLPSRFKYHLKYDLKGSTFKRRASKAELAKKSPTRKDLDFLSDHPEGILLEAETYDVVMKTIMRDCRVLESFKIMDYSLLLGIHNLDQAVKDKALNSPYPSAEVLNDNPERVARRDEFSAALEAIQIDREGDRPVGGVPAKNAKGERLILFIGIIDILQSYRLQKKLEHGWKSFLHDGDTVSVHKPSFYAKRFLEFMGNKVFRRMPTVTRGPSKRRTGVRQGGTPYRGKTSVVEAPVVRLGDDMVPPPYELPEPAPSAVESPVASNESDIPKLESSTVTKTVKFNVDEVGEKETGEDSSAAEAATIAEDEPLSDVPTSGGRDKSGSEVETAAGTVTITKTVHGNPEAGEETKDPKAVDERETTNELKEVSQDNVSKVKESAESSVSSARDSFGSYKVTIVKEMHSVGSDDKEHFTISTHTEGGLKPEVQMKPSGSSEFVIIENAVPKPDPGEEHTKSSEKGMNDSVAESVTSEEPESSTSKL